MKTVVWRKTAIPVCLRQEAKKCQRKWFSKDITSPAGLALQRWAPFNNLEPKVVAQAPQNGSLATTSRSSQHENSLGASEKELFDLADLFLVNNKVRLFHWTI
jgi:hypothetical protein